MMQSAWPRKQNNPFYLLLGTVALIPIDFLTTLPNGISLIKISGVALLLTWFRQKINQQKLLLPPRQVTFFLLAFVGYLAVSLVWTSDLAVGATKLFSILANVLLCLLLYDLVRDEMQLRQLILCLLVGGICSVILGFLTQQFSIPAVHEVPRFLGGVGEPNELAAIMAVIMPLAVYQLYAQNKASVRLVALLYILLALPAIRYSYSRGGLLALGPALLLICYCFYSQRSGKQILISCGLLLVLAWNITAGITDDYYQQRATSIVTLEDGGAGRLAIWQEGLQHLYPRKPIIGFGLGSFSQEIYPFLHKRIIAHNMFISFLIETGLLGLGLFLGLLCQPLLGFGHLWKQKRYTLLELGVLTSFLAVLTAGLFLYLEYKKITWLLIGLALVVCCNPWIRPNTARQKEPRRVMHIIYSLEAAGAQQLLVDMLRNADLQQFRYTVCCVAWGGPLTADLQQLGIPVFIIGKQRKLDFVVLMRLYRLLKAQRTDILVTHMFTANCWGRLAAVMAGIQLVFAVEHGIDRYKGWRHDLVDRILLICTDKVIAVSNHVQSFLVQEKHLPPGKVVVIKNGIDLQRITGQETATLLQVAAEDRLAFQLPPEAELPPAFQLPIEAGPRSASNLPAQAELPSSITAKQNRWLRQELGLADHSLLVGIIGRLEPVKGHRIFLAAAQQIIRERDDVQFLIVGEGGSRACIEQFIQVNQLTTEVKLLGVRRDIKQLLQLLDIFTLTSLSEGIPLALLEAMACKKPVIATSVGGIPEVLKHLQTGLLIHPESTADLVFSLRLLLADQQLRRRYGEAAFTEVISHWDVAETVRQYEQLYTQSH